jgi:glycosyltransferase involved in cell wall biosynthesis
MENEQKIDISVVVPVYNEEGNITKLNAEIQKVVSGITGAFEVIFVNDGSTDGSLRELKALKNITIINLNRRYGQTTAFDAGFKAAQGDLVISLDGDGQDDPHNFPALIKKLKDDDLDVVAGWRKHRRDKSSVRILTKIGQYLRKKMINDTIHDSGCALRVYRKEAAKSLDIGGEMHRYIMALLRWKGFRIGEVAVNHRKREHGVSNYNYSKAVRGFIDLVYVWFLYKFSQRPLHLFGYASIISFFFGTVSGIWTVYEKIALGVSISRNGWALVTFFLLLSGIMYFSFGIIIGLLFRVHYSSSEYEKRYYIREVIKR